MSLGTLYFSFSLSLWTSKQICDWRILAIAIFVTLVSVIHFAAVFSESLLSRLTRLVQRPLVLLTFLLFLLSYLSGWLQAFVESSGHIRGLILYFGFSWVVVFLLTLIRDTASQGRTQRLFAFLIIGMLLITSAVRFYYRDLWGGAYLISIAALALAVALNRLRVHGGLFE